MIAKTHWDITTAVLAEVERAENPRFKEILRCAVTHLHGFVRDAQLTEAEFQQACRVLAQLGQATTPSHNEVVLAAGSLGVSALVCLLNNAPSVGAPDTTANLLGPFWREGSPPTANGASIVRSPTPGVPIFVDAWVRNAQGQAVADARVDVWHSSAEGHYENQDPSQAEMNLRGSFTTDAAGHIAFRSIKPVGYPIPVNGPVGDLLRAQGRHNLRPAHIHFLIHKPGYKTQFAQVYSSDDPHLETDVQFGVTQALVGRYVRHEAPTPAALAPAPDVQGPWYALAHHFVLTEGAAQWPKPPITGKVAGGQRPDWVVLERKP